MAKMSKYSGPERRKHPRLDVSFVVSYRVKEPPVNYDMSQSKNVSQGGMMLTTNRHFDKGTHLAIKVRFPFLPDKLEVWGEVVDCKEIAKNVIYETRIKFIGPEGDMFEKLGEFVKERLKR